MRSVSYTHLVLDVEENITLPVLMDGKPVNKERLEELLAFLNLSLIHI